MNRRQFLSALGAGIWASSAPGLALGQTFWDLPRTLWLKRAATGEEAKVVYWANGVYLPEGYRQLCYLLRDVRSNQTVAMDPVLLDILRGMQGWFEMHGIERPTVINSGYRNLTTNRLTEGAAPNSEHPKGKAADIIIPDVPTNYLAQLATYLRGGGVGFYPSKGFLHVDSGRLRSWKG